MARMPRFREFPPLRTATIGVIIIAALLVGAFTYPKLPFVAGHTYTADFTDGGGLRVTDTVQVAGIEVGQVTDMELVGDHVEVSFTAKNGRMATNSTAAIKTGTLLGKRYLGIDPGTGPEMNPSDTIPVSRTTTPYNVSRSIEDVTAQLAGFDKPKIEAALNSFADAFQDTPANFKATFENVKRLSLTISSRDQTLRELLSHANGVSGVLADRTESFRKILIDGNQLLAELQRRQELFNELFRNFNYVAEQARQFVRENNEQLGPVLDELNQMLSVIQKNNANLQLAIQRVSSFITGLGEGIGEGPFFNVDISLGSVGSIFNLTDALRQAQNPQVPPARVPELPCLPGGGDVPNPAYAPPSGSGADRPLPPPSDACGQHNPLPSSGGQSLPLLGGN